jgi:DNA-directed RNA polymerase subunit RPC12/RpoP
MNKEVNNFEMLEVVKPERCTYCSTGAMIRVKRSYLVKYIFTWVGEKKYKCDNCGKVKYTK